MRRIREQGAILCASASPLNMTTKEETWAPKQKNRVHELASGERTGKLVSVGESEIKNLSAPHSMKVQFVAPIAAISKIQYTVHQGKVPRDAASNAS